MYLATRPLEYVCFFVMEVPVKEGNAHLYLAMDAYSELAFSIGMELSGDSQTLLKHIGFLMEHPDFKKHRHKGFTLVFHKYYGLTNEINAIIKPFGGKFLTNDVFVTVVMDDFLKGIYKNVT